MTWTLVTGAAKGLGAQICRQLAANGYSVVIHYNRSEHEAYDLAAECQKRGVEAQSIQGDFSTAEGTADFITRYQNRFAQTTNLINNVGNYFQAPASVFTGEQGVTLFQENLHAPIAITSALIPSLTAQKGAVVNLGVAGLGQLTDTQATTYAMTKEALLMYTRTLARELAPAGVRVNMVSPGHLENSIVKLDPATLPMRRVGKLDEVARVVAFLLDPQNSYITGQNIEVAGGVRL